MIRYKGAHVSAVSTLPFTPLSLPCDQCFLVVTTAMFYSNFAEDYLQHFYFYSEKFPPLSHESSCFHLVLTINVLYLFHHKILLVFMTNHIA